MSKHPEAEGQQRLSVVRKVIPIVAGEKKVDEDGQTKLFDTIDELIAQLPPGLNDVLQLMNQKMSNLQLENHTLLNTLEEHKDELSRVVESNTQQVNRLGSSVAKLAGKFEEKVVSGIDPDLAISPHVDITRADVALVDSALPAEAVYPYTTGELAALIGITASRLGHFFKMAGIQGNCRYHCSIKTGKTNFVQKYKVKAVRALFDAVNAGNVPDMKPADRALLSHCVGMFESANN